MFVKNTLIKLTVAVAAFVIPAAASAQSSSINAFSPYTMYGIGELNTPGTTATRSMGGIGVAMRNARMVNTLNPAAYSLTPRKSFLFSLGLEGQNYYNYQTVKQNDGYADKQSAYNTFNLHDIAIQIPLGKRIGFGMSLMPYSSVGYRISYRRPYSSSDPVQGNIGSTKYAYEGSGDITEVKFGVGMQIFKNVSLGIAAQYYWGDITRLYSTTFLPITGDGAFGATTGVDNYSVSTFKGQVGLMWNVITSEKRALTVGATFDFGGDIKPDKSSKVTTGSLHETVVVSDTTQLRMVLPRQLTLGTTYQTSKWLVGVDYTYQNWGGKNKGTSNTLGENAADNFAVSYTNTSTLKMGMEFTPSRYDVRHFLKRCSYRAGFRYGNYHQTFGGEKLHQYALSLGVGIPVKFLGSSSVDVGVEFGRRGYNLAKSLGLIRQQYVKFSVGFSLFAGSENGEYWFMRPKYD